jgi:integrase
MFSSEIEKGYGMRAKGRKQGRFVALSGLKKVPGPPGGRYQLLVIDAAGLPVFPLCEWYRYTKEFDSGRTPDTYLDMALPFFGFLLQRGYAWNAPPKRVRASLVEFLRSDVGCQVGQSQEDGYQVETTASSPLSKSSLGVLLAALTNLYDVLSYAGYYPFPNPMRSERLVALRREHMRWVKNAGAPEHAGIRSETHRETEQNYPTAYFRQKRGKVWEPDVVMEPDEVHDRMRQTVDFMIMHATFQRDQIILLLLRQTGARLSEIIEMTVGGYRNARHTGRALVKNKRSRGREEKTVYFTDVIDEQLLTYIRTERARYDPRGRKRIDQLSDEDPLFLTEDGNPYSRSAFYYHWRKLFAPAQTQFEERERVEFTPHDLRHLRVTRGMSKIEQEAQGNPRVEAELRDGFWRLMGWSSPRTMEIYRHTMNKRAALLKIALDDQSNREPTGAQIVTSGTPILVKPVVPSSPAIVAEDDDDFSWYEEE